MSRSTHGLFRLCKCVYMKVCRHSQAFLQRCLFLIVLLRKFLPWQHERGMSHFRFVSPPTPVPRQHSWPHQQPTAVVMWLLMWCWVCSTLEQKAFVTRHSWTVAFRGRRDFGGGGEASNPRNVRNKSHMKYSDLCIIFFWNLILTLAFFHGLCLFFPPPQAPSCAVLCFFLPSFLFFFLILILKPDRLNSQLQGYIAVGTPSFPWLPELLLPSPGLGFSMVHPNPASMVYVVRKKDLLVELWPGSPRSRMRGLGGQGDAAKDPGWDG